MALLGFAASILPMEPSVPATPLRRLALALALLAPVAGAETAPPLSLDLAMSHPDWIGPPVERLWWSAIPRKWPTP
jgi:hypothetical protein